MIGPFGEVVEVAGAVSALRGAWAVVKYLFPDVQGGVIEHVTEGGICSRLGGSSARSAVRDLEKALIAATKRAAAILADDEETWPARQERERFRQIAEGKGSFFPEGNDALAGAVLEALLVGDEGALVQVLEPAIEWWEAVSVPATSARKRFGGIFPKPSGAHLARC